MPQILLASFIATGASIILMRQLARYTKLMDPIQGHKRHTKETALVGGAAMSIGIISLAFSAPESFSNNILIINLSILMMISGILDDAFGLTTVIRLAIQIILGGILFYLGNIRFLSLGDIVFTGPVGLGFFALPFTIIAISGAVNAINMMDGYDGLAGGLALITLAFMGILCIQAGSESLFHLILALGVSVTTFLLFNYRFPWSGSASAFMGDGGAYSLGFLIACIFLVASQGPDAFLPPVLALWIMAVPLIDIAGVISRRLLRGGNAMDADRDHIHHILVGSGYSEQRVVMFLHGAAMLFGFIGLMMHAFGVPEGLMFILFLMLCAVYFFMVNKLLKRLNKSSLDPSS